MSLPSLILRDEFLINSCRVMLKYTYDYIYNEVNITSKYIDKWIIYLHKNGLASKPITKNWLTDGIKRLERHTVELIDYRSILEKRMQMLELMSRYKNKSIFILNPEQYSNHMILCFESIFRKIQNIETNINILTSLLKSFYYNNSETLEDIQKYNSRLSKNIRIMEYECKILV